MALHSLHVGWIVDGTGNTPKRNMILEIEGDRLRGIFPPRGKFLRESPGDLTRFTLLPALVDAHVHLLLSGSADSDIRRHQLRFSFREAAAVVEHHIHDHIAHGVLILRDGGDYGGYALRFKREVLLPSDPPIRLVAAGKGWHAAGRYGRLVGRPPLKGRTLAASIRETRDGAEVVKIVHSGINSLSAFGKETPSQFPASELKRAIEAARGLGLRTMVHANGPGPVREALDAGCDSIEHGFLMGRDNLRRMADRGITWVPTVFTMEAYARILPPGSREAEAARRYLDHQLEQIRLAREWGVSLAVGTDAGSPGVHHGTAVQEEIRLLMRAGYPLEEAIRCATEQGAALCGYQGKVGRLAAGWEATFIVIRGGPEELPGALASPEKIYFKGRPLEEIEGKPGPEAPNRRQRFRADSKIRTP
ncbi:MAG: amidohydrolase family protein [Deltaproteobacteria bacterium]|nr:amidohydrolase family protein [Deltaproteobacteria bacterium]